MIAIVVVWGRQESWPCVVARILRWIDDEVAISQGIISAARDLVVIGGSLREATPNSVVPSVHVLGITLLVMKEVAANLVRIAEEMRCEPAIVLGHCRTCIGVPEGIPMPVRICGLRIKPEFGGMSIRRLQVPTV